MQGGAWFPALAGEHTFVFFHDLHDIANEMAIEFACILSRCEPLLEPLGVVLACFWSVLGSTLMPLWPNRSQIGSTWGQLGVNIGHIGSNLVTENLQKSYTFPNCFV